MIDRKSRVSVWKSWTLLWVVTKYVSHALLQIWTEAQELLLLRVAPVGQISTFYSWDSWLNLHMSLRSTPSAEVDFTNFLGSHFYLGFLKSQLESRFQEVVIHQFRAKNATWVVILAWVALFNNTDYCRVKILVVFYCQFSMVGKVKVIKLLCYVTSYF